VARRQCGWQDPDGYGWMNGWLKALDSARWQVPRNAAGEEIDVRGGRYTVS